MTRSILITGCSSGIGAHCATVLRDRGWRVFAACRAEADCERLRAQGFDSPRIDYADPHSIETGLQEVLDATGGRLDALFNNGAYAIPGLVEDLPTDALRTIFEANLFGWHELTRQVIPVMRAQNHGRIVQNSSILGFMPYRWRGAYTASKFALEGLSRSLALELADTPIHVVRIQPGPIASQFRANSARQFDRWIDCEASAKRDAYRDQLIPRLTAQQSHDRFQLGPDAVARVLIKALEARNPRPRYLVTLPTKAMSVVNRFAPDRWLAWLLSRG